ncbi:expressed unknown protein [Seminavis robusta]|uniref:BTB domain-containing protein n=1 Tax=Seminavis robusta TaxID=568900 RepID=A0A9N8EVC8_9STRA|nr:expressed unknown protein [Seminavis robusta]|eukprot:Sro2088_g313911.1  (454) ;mRNA; f:5093-6454
MSITAWHPEIQEEVPLSAAFATLADEKYCDVSLRGNDNGELIRASRIALSVRSPFFAVMFENENFKETKQDIVSIAFSSTLLKAIVEYIYTDNPSFLNKMTNSPPSDAEIEITPEFMESKFHSLVSLTEAAVYFGLPGLCQKTQTCLSTLLTESHALAFAILAASKQVGPVISEELTTQAIEIFDDVRSDVLNKVVLGGIDAITLKAVIQDNSLWKNHAWRSEAVFRVLPAWCESNPSTPNETKEGRQEEAMIMWKDEGLGFVQPETQKFLWYQVDPRPEAEARLNTLLFCIGPFLLGGKYQWEFNKKFDSQNLGSNSWLGIIKTTTRWSESECKGRRFGIMGDNGTSWSDGVCTQLGPDTIFGIGSHHIIMALDLTSSNGDNGTLSITINDRAPIVISSNLRGHLEGPLVGFVPVVRGIFQVGTLFGFEELETAACPAEEASDEESDDGVWA